MRVKRTIISLLLCCVLVLGLLTGCSAKYADAKTMINACKTAAGSITTTKANFSGSIEINFNMSDGKSDNSFELSIPMNIEGSIITDKSLNSHITGDMTMDMSGFASMLAQGDNGAGSRHVKLEMYTDNTEDNQMMYTYNEVDGVWTKQSLKDFVTQLTSIIDSAQLDESLFDKAEISSESGCTVVKISFGDLLKNIKFDTNTIKNTQFGKVFDAESTEMTDKLWSKIKDVKVIYRFDTEKDLIKGIEVEETTIDYDYANNEQAGLQSTGSMTFGFKYDVESYDEVPEEAVKVPEDVKNSASETNTVTEETMKGGSLE